MEKLEEPTEESAAIICGDWTHRIRPVVKNLSKRSSKYWMRLEEIVEERYKKFLSSKPVEKLTLEFNEDEELAREEYSKVEATIQEMIMKALPKGLMTEAVQKRYSNPEAVLLMIMVKYQPGTRKEKEALLEQIQNPESSWKEEKALSNLEMWKRGIERAKDLKASIPDPCIFLIALDTITYNAITKDPRRAFRATLPEKHLQ